MKDILLLDQHQMKLKAGALVLKVSTVQEYRLVFKCPRLGHIKQTLLFPIKLESWWGQFICRLFVAHCESTQKVKL